ncbi:unnamed protein product [Parnassius apollo]|uniref:(apollo) hypothetical protein n=1 Tax=Parnassius apollo TaxID=110799 RepID=A0A8S3WG57_PARAO|nr:unnamed protein product [Parnassius apollo]
MAAFTNFTFLVLLICCVFAFGEHSGSIAKPESSREPAQGKNVPEPQQRRLEKRSLDHEDGDLDDTIFQPAYENAFDRPHRIRVLPGYLH